jgi:nucleoside-diphosphate-sugar epimerase
LPYSEITSPLQTLVVVVDPEGRRAKLNVCSGIMSGGSEANFDLGWNVNFNSHVSLLQHTHAHAKEINTKPLYVFVSSLAVYGGPKCLPESYVVPADTPALPQTSYGIQKFCMEMYVYDYGRKGYLDSRSVRLPTVAVRTGAVGRKLRGAEGRGC